MTTEQNKDKTVLGYRSVIGIAGLVGIIGGFLFGVWDSITVIIDRGLPYDALTTMASLTLYSVAVYTVIGCLGMVVIGAISGSIIRVGRYGINKSQLARVFIGVFLLFAVAVIIADILMLGSVAKTVGNIVNIFKSAVVSFVSGIGIAVTVIAILVYVRGRKVRKEKLIAICITLFVSILVLVFGGLLINMKLLPTEKFYQPISLLTNIGLLIMVVLIAVGVYVLSSSMLKRYSSGAIRQTGYTLLTIVLCTFLAVSIMGPFSGDKISIAASGAARGKPNILWIVMDTVRADHLSCYGYHRNTTPNIDRIASEGALYESAIAEAPWTVPSHASMFTGLYPSRHGTDAEHQWLDGDFETIAEVLRSYGYSTFCYTNNNCVGPAKNLNQGFSNFKAVNMGVLEAGSELTNHLKVSNFKRYIRNLLLIDDGAQRTNEVVKKWIAEADKVEAPFFVFINYMEAHETYHPPKKYVAPYLRKNIDLAEARKVKQDPALHISGKEKLSEDAFQMLRALYDGELSYLDFRIGQLCDYLQKLKILDDTILIITSDHGENFGEHGLMAHMLCVYDTLVHVPLIIRYPDSFEAGLRIKEQVQLTDIFPTILDIVGIDWAGREQIQGNSLFGDKEQNQSAFVIAEHAIWHDVLEALRDRNRMCDVSEFARRLKTVRTDEYKYIWGSDGRHELYNIRLDPEELNNLIEVEPVKASEMKELLIEWLNSFEPYRPEAGLLLK